MNEKVARKVDNRQSIVYNFIDEKSTNHEKERGNNKITGEEEEKNKRYTTQ